MSNRKIKLAFFTIAEWEREQEWLMKQHRAGWELRNATLPCFYTFEKCKPEDVVYQLDYNKDGLEHKSEYIQMFRDCGWEYITDMAGYSYFRKPVSEMNEKEEIFCDEDSRIDMLERVFRGRMIPCIAIFFLIIIPQLFMQAVWNDVTHHVLFGVYVILLVMYVVMFIKFGLQYMQLKRRMGR
ncbi:MAG: DUF2812 domain-containing protein [Lachnospiraceae bacterium]|nr:DUF2812 domain-containing protein [Lachnospiraceae bacterium]